MGALGSSVSDAGAKEAEAERVEATRALKPVANEGGTTEKRCVWKDRVYAE